MLKKVLVWRVISISITYVLTWIHTGNIKEAGLFTLLVHSTLALSQWCFEKWWESLE